LRRRRILYIAYWGLREPLGRSLVLPAVEKLARDVDIHLVTFEKPRDLRDRPGMAEYRERLERRGVRWTPLRYHKRPRLPATAFDVAHGAARAVVAARAARPDLVHARTFVGGVIGLPVSRLLGVPLVYHNEGFWPDQQIEGGFWPSGGALYRTMKRTERLLYESADGLLLLSEKSRPMVEQLPGVRRRQPPIAIVPSCVDLDRFSCGGVSRDGTGLRLAYVGSLGGRYPVAPLAGFLMALRRLEPSTRLEILSHSDHGAIRSALLSAGAPEDAWDLSTVPHEEVPARLCRARAGLFFLQGGIGALSCSPTKIGEYWACGLPVVMSAGVGDLDDVIRSRRVGLVVGDLTAQTLAAAAGELLALLRDPGLSARCREAARAHYSLSAGVEVQLDLYERILPAPGRERVAG
jgi:glycosyltransferase involved in cell wall biosynthesis